MLSVADIEAQIERQIGIAAAMFKLTRDEAITVMRHFDWDQLTI